MRNPEPFLKIIKHNLGVYEYFNYDLKSTITKDKISVKCIKHKTIFTQSIDSIYAKATGCKECIIEKKRTPLIDFNEFVEKSKKTHGNKYYYYKDTYKNVSTSITIHCSIHGDFNQVPFKHYGGQGCYKCYLNDKSTKNSKPRKGNSFKDKSKIAIQNWDFENNNMSPEEISIKSSSFKINWKCLKCGNTWIKTPKVELMGSGGCLKCGFGREIIEDIPKKGMSFGDLFPDLLNSFSLKNDLNPFELGIRSNKVVLWNCPQNGHESWRTSIYRRTIMDRGCQSCGESQGERKIVKILNENNIEYIREWTNETLRSSLSDRILRVDFAIPDFKILIEYDGIQHFEPVNYYIRKNSTPEETFKIVQQLDKDKNKWAVKNNWIMFRISYKESIQERMNELIKLHFK